MASPMEGIGLPGFPTRLTMRLQERLARLVEAVKSRDGLRSTLPLVPGERVLATTCDSSGSWVAVSERALYHHVGDDPSGMTATREWARVGWEEIGNVQWNDHECTLTFTGLVPTVARRTVLHLPNGAPVGLLAHERVAWTAVVRTDIQLGEHGRARVIGRRRPGSEELTWLVGLDGDTADLQAALESALHELRGRLGV